MKSKESRIIPLVGEVEERRNKAFKNVYFSKNTNSIGEKQQKPVIFFILEGEIRISFDSIFSQKVSKGELFLIPPNCAYEVQIIEDSQVMMCMFQMDQLPYPVSVIEELIPYGADFDSEFPQLNILPMLYNYLLLLKGYIDAGIDDYYLFELKKEELFYLLFSCYTKRELVLLLHPIICIDMKFKDFILNNFLSAKNVQELAEMANYSTSGFIKKFQRYFNESPYRWMIKQKSRRILADLCLGQKTLQEIVDEYHFSSYQHFADFCKVKYGRPPTELSGKKMELTSVLR